VSGLERSSPELVMSRGDASLITVAETLELLAEGEVEVLGLLPYSSNYVFLARVEKDGTETLAVYKPTRGERPLWDFPSGTLAAREAAAFVVSHAGGWNLVPPTVLRNDAPLGAGSLQLFIEHDPERHFFTLAEERLPDLVSFAAWSSPAISTDCRVPPISGVASELANTWFHPFTTRASGICFLAR
jgi:hypothetical protein